MTQYPIREFRVNTLPTKGKPNSRYYVPNGNGTDLDEYITDLSGNYRKVTPIIPSATERIEENLIGTIDGSNATFTTSESFNPSTVTIYINGIRQKKPNDFNTVGNNTVLFTLSPEIGDDLYVTYVKL